MWPCGFMSGLSLVPDRPLCSLPPWFLPFVPEVPLFFRFRPLISVFTMNPVFFFCKVVPFDYSSDALFFLAPGAFERSTPVVCGASPHRALDLAGGFLFLLDTRIFQAVGGVRGTVVHYGPPPFAANFPFPFFFFSSFGHIWDTFYERPPDQPSPPENLHCPLAGRTHFSSNRCRYPLPILWPPLRRNFDVSVNLFFVFLFVALSFVFFFGRFETFLLL